MKLKLISKLSRLWLNYADSIKEFLNHFFEYRIDRPITENFLIFNIWLLRKKNSKFYYEKIYINSWIHFLLCLFSQCFLIFFFLPFLLQLRTNLLCSLINLKYYNYLSKNLNIDRRTTLLYSSAVSLTSIPSSPIRFVFLCKEP
jgi:hypothetical protein